jgi:ADP-ribose pyrophosphatase YjhB (NUDIX family)
MGNCWGTIGGLNEDGIPPDENAAKELREETGYGGEIDLRLLSVFSGYRFRYYNFAGIVASVFALELTSDSAWENDRLCWFEFTEILRLLRVRPKAFHFGVVELFQYASAAIGRIVAEIPAEK